MITDIGICIGLPVVAMSVCEWYDISGGHEYLLLKNVD